MLRRLLSIAVLAAAGIVHAASAEPPEISLQPVSTLVPHSAVMIVSGTTASGCAPVVAAVEQHARELVLQSLDGSRECLPGPQPYTLRSGMRSVPQGVWRLRYERRASATSPARLEAFRLVDLNGPRPRPTPEAGFWWGEQGGEFDAAGPGFGVQLELQGDTVALAVSGYDADGVASWLFGAAPLDGHVVTIPLVRLAGGRGPHDEFRGPDGASDAGRVHIEWLGSARAVFWFEHPAADGEGIDLRPVSMVRFGFGSGAGEQWKGRWLLGPRQASGDDTIVPRTVDFVRFEPALDGFTLATAAGERLDCRLDSSRAGSPPMQCRLEAFGLPPIEFDDVGLNRLTGASADRQAEPAVLLRLER